MFYLYHRKWQIIMWFLVWLKVNMEYIKNRNRERKFSTCSTILGLAGIELIFFVISGTELWFGFSRKNEFYVALPYILISWIWHRYIYLCVSLCVQIFLWREIAVPEWAWWATSEEFWEPVMWILMIPWGTEECRSFLTVCLWGTMGSFHLGLFSVPLLMIWKTGQTL